MRSIGNRGVLLVVLLAIMGMPAWSWARQVDCSEALTVGQNFINDTTARTGGWGDEKNAFVQKCTEFKRKDRLVGYYLPVSPTGYIVVSRLTQLSPIKSYSTTDNLDLNYDIGYVAMLKETMDGVLTFLETNYGFLSSVPEEGIAPTTNKDEWDWHLGKRSKPLTLDQAGNSVDTVTIGGLTTTTWNQGAPYNNFCPAGDGGICVTGCVATAAAQVMKYWNYPYAGIGSHSYSWDGDQSCGGSVGGGTLSTTFSSHFYDWGNMLNSYSGTFNTTQSNAVAQLMYDAGMAWEMDYGTCGSAAWTGGGVLNYPTYFNYANTTIEKDRSSYATAADWFAAIRQEFDNPLPRVVHYRINTHSIVCDGYQTGTTNYIHLNYGWSDSHNNWYAVDNLYCPWAGCSYTVEYMVAGIQPKNRRYIAVKGMDNNIYVSYWWHDTGAFQGWYTIGGSSSHAPAMAVFNNREYMAVKGNANNYIYIRSKDYAGVWSSWTTVSGQTTLSPALISYNNRLYLFVKGASDNNIYYRSMDANGLWSSWNTFGFSSTDTPSLTVWDNKLFVFVKGETDNLLYYTYMDSAGTWAGAWWLGIDTNAAPAAVVYNNVINIFYKGSADNSIYQATSTDPYTPSWYGYTITGKTSVSPSVAVEPETNRLYMAVKGNANNYIYVRYYDMGTGWSSWTTTGGQTNDTPALNVFYYIIP